MNGIAIWLTWVPKSETVAAVHSRDEVRLAEEAAPGGGGHVAPRLVGGRRARQRRHVSLRSNTR